MRRCALLATAPAAPPARGAPLPAGPLRLLMGYPAGGEAAWRCIN